MYTNSFISFLAIAAAPLLTQASALPNTSPNTARSTVLHSGAGASTFYYDINGAGTCGPANGISSYPETNGYPMCNPSTSLKTLKEYGTDYIVAIGNNHLRANPSWCGKRVKAYANGKLINKVFVVWDGCERCNSDDGVDFSATAFADLWGKDHCADGIEKTGFKWELTDEVIYDKTGKLVGKAPGSSAS